jgi:acyl carrier protein
MDKMDRQQLIEWTNAVFADEFEIPPEKLKPEAQIFGELGLDSLDVVDLIVALQKKFKITIRGDQRILEIRSLEDLYNYLESIGKENFEKP